MKRGNILGLGVLILIISVLGATIYNVYTQKNESNENTSSISSSNEQYDLELKYEYIEDNTWTYKVTGSLPNSCYTIDIDVTVAESYPEQVLVKATITPPSEDLICVEQVQDVYKTGDFQASEYAVVSFSMK